MCCFYQLYINAYGDFLFAQCASLRSLHYGLVLNNQRLHIKNHHLHLKSFKAQQQTHLKRKYEIVRLAPMRRYYSKTVLRKNVLPNDAT